MEDNLVPRGKARDNNGYIELYDLDYRCSKCGRGEARGKTMTWDVGIGALDPELETAPVYLLCDRCSVDSTRLASEDAALPSERSPLS